MSRRFQRALLVLYPARFRRRYGSELLQLQDELRRDGEISRARLGRDAITGAFIARSARQRALMFAGGVFVASLIAVALTGSDSARRSSSMPRAQLAATVMPPTRPAFPYGRSCFVGAGTSCSLRACVEYTASPQASTTPTARAQKLDKPASPQATKTCVSNPKTLLGSSSWHFVTDPTKTAMVNR